MSQPANEERSQPEILEKFLREAKVISIDKESLGGRTGPWRITLDDGTTQRRAVFRYIDRPRPAIAPDSYKYDLAAYELTKLLGIELVPPVVERNIDSRKGSLQIFLENCLREKDRRRKKLEPPDARAFANALAGVRVFEALVNDECNNIDHIYIHKEDWRVCRIDFTEAFYPAFELQPGCELTVCARALYAELLRLNEETVKSVLNIYLSAEDISALLARKNLIVEKFKALIAEKGEAAVLF